MVRVALIGCGKWGKNYIKAVHDSGFGRVSHIFTSRSPFLSPLDGVSVNLNSVKQCTLPEDLQGIEVFSFDAAIVATHPPKTERFSIKLLEMGTPVMAEKPFAFTLSALQWVQKILDLRDHSPVFLINHQHLFSSAVLFLKQVVSKGGFRLFCSNAGGLGPFRDYSPIWDYGPHDLAILCYLTDSQLDLARVDCQKDGIGIRETITVRAAGDRESTLAFWNNLPPKKHYVVVETERDRVVYDDFDPRGKIQINGSYPNLRYCPPLTLSVRAFLSQVKSGGKCHDNRFGTSLAQRYTTLLSDYQSAQRSGDDGLQ